MTNSNDVMGEVKMSDYSEVDGEVKELELEPLNDVRAVVRLTTVLAEHDTL